MGLRGDESIPILMWVVVGVFALFAPIVVWGYVGYFRGRLRAGRRWWSEPVLLFTVGSVAGLALWFTVLHGDAVALQ